MILIACVDDSLGMMFHNRRVSRDKAVTADMVKMCGKRCLYVEEYSRKLFEAEEDGLEKVKVLDFASENSFIDEFKDSVSAKILEKCASARAAEDRVSAEKFCYNRFWNHFEGEYFFVENTGSIQNVMKHENRIEKIVLYYWNRKYPADQYFPIDLTEWTETGREEFPGNSHEKITKVIYVKKLAGEQ